MFQNSICDQPSSKVQPLEFLSCNVMQQNDFPGRVTSEPVRFLKFVLSGSPAQQQKLTFGAIFGTGFTLSVVVNTRRILLHFQFANKVCAICRICSLAHLSYLRKIRYFLLKSVATKVA